MNRRAIYILLTAVVLVGLLSVVKWGDLTSHVLKDYNLFGDLFKDTTRRYVTQEIVDPALAELQEEMIAKEGTADSVDTSGDQGSDTMVQPDTERAVPQAQRDEDGNVMIEDYSADGSGLERLQNLLSESASRLVRIAVPGDSYIEGDLLTQDLRGLLQSQYGGEGVGYVAAYSAHPGFRGTVHQSGSGWTEREIRKESRSGIRLIQGTYYVGEAGASATYKGSKSVGNVSSWSQSILAFIAPSDGTITITTDIGEEVREVTASEGVQFAEVTGSTSSFSFTSTISDLKVLGVWLTGNIGVNVDNMSIRGNSGISHRFINSEVTQQLRSRIDYDVIILEFGINALTSEQTDYSAYTAAMVSAVKVLKENYPNAIVLILGIGDRGQKQDTEIHSLATAQNMVKAQREIARRTGSLFWDMREAMGGEDAVVDWYRRGLINSDFIHLNAKGGREVANLLFNALIQGK